MSLVPYLCLRFGFVVATPANAHRNEILRLAFTVSLVSPASAVSAHQCPSFLLILHCPARCLLLASRACPMAALSKTASLVLFDVLTFHLFAAPLCLSTHRSDRRRLQPLP